MNSVPLTLHSFPRAIIHIDGDAFFASCEQARNPALKNRPVITGKERGIASSLSYEAKACGVSRGMRLSEIKKICPDAVILPSDYETYSLLSQRFFSIVCRYTPDVERYSIDECFADLTGLRRLYRTSYQEIAGQIKNVLDKELGFTFSAGLGPNKVIAKIASKWKKPSGLTVIAGRDIHLYLDRLLVEKVWGIGSQTAAFLEKYGIKTALQFARHPEQWIKSKLSKPFYEIWQELNGNYVLHLETEEKESYASIQKVKTFTPPSNNPEFVFAQLSKNLENACMKARRYNLEAKEIMFFLRTQGFQDTGYMIKFSRQTVFSNEITSRLREPFREIFNPQSLYRSTGIILTKLKEKQESQMDLFGSHLEIEKMTRVYESLDEIRKKYGKHTLFWGSSFMAHKFEQHEGERGELSERKKKPLPGETKRKHLGIPMFTGEVK